MTAEITRLTPVEKMWKKLYALSDKSIDLIWDALMQSDWDDDDIWGDGITMLKWSEAVQAERKRRRLI